MGDRKSAAVLFALAALVYLFLQNWTPQEADAEVGFQATRALALRGELYLSPDTDSAARILATVEPQHGDAYNCRREENGTRQYPYWGLAYVAAGVPFYIAGRAFDAMCPEINKQFATQRICAEGFAGSEYFARVFVFSLQPLSAALALVFVFLAARRAGAERPAALLAALALGFGTHMGVQARSGLSDAMAVAVMAWVVERAVAAWRSGSAFDCATFGAAAGIAILTKIHTAFAAAPLPLLLLASPGARPRPGRSAAYFAAGVAPGLALFLIANHVRWGNPFITGYEKSTAQAWFRINPLDGMNAMLFSPSKGVLLYAFPVFLGGLSGAIAMLWRGAAMVGIVLLVSALAALAMPASTIEWHGSWAFGPRYALVAYPQLATLSAAAICPFARRRWLAGGVVLAGVALVLPGMFTSSFGGIAVAMEGARVRWTDTDPSFPAAYDAGSREAERFQRICLAPLWDPLNLLRVQHALARKAFEGKATLQYRADLHVNKDGEAAPPPLKDFRTVGSVGIIGFFDRFQNQAFAAAAALLALFSLAGAVAFAVFRFSPQFETS
jgi:hypothetical protein